MKKDVNGCSTKKGQESYQYFSSRTGKKTFVQYDYRTPEGKLFTCVSENLSLARQQKNIWLQNN